MAWRPTWRQRSDEDFAREIQAHLRIEADRLVEEGMTADAARDAARRSFGNVLAAQERFHEAHRWAWLEQVALDVRYAWRGLRKSPAFLVTVVLTLAVGLGLVTSLFAVFNAYVLRPFAVRDPYALHQIVWRALPTHRRGGLEQLDGGYAFRWRDFEELQTRRDLFDDVVATSTRVVLSNGRPVVALFASGNFFEALGPRMRLGRGLAPFDAAAPGASPVAVLTDGGWATLFDRDPDVLGRQLDLNGRSLVVVGVLRPEFSGLDDTPRDVLVPITMFQPVARTDIFGGEQPREVGLVARLRAGVTAPQVEAALAPFISRVVDRRDPVRAEARLLATPNPLTVGLVTLLSPVFAAFLLVLAAACANVSNMLLARASARHREIGMRLSLGASRGRVIRQLLTEGLLMAVLGGVAGLALAAAILRVGTAAFLAALPPYVAGLVRVAPLDLDHRVFAFAFGVAAMTTLVFALAPALHATRLSLTHALRGQAGAAGRGSTLRNALVVSQVTVSLVLLVTAMTLVRNGLALRATHLGFETRGVISVKPAADGQENVARAAALLAGDPRVAAVAATSLNPLSERSAKMPLVSRPGAPVVATSYKFVSPEYFPLLRIPMLSGRGFSSAEAAAGTPVTIVSAAAARALWPGESPLGRTLEVRVERLGEGDGALAPGSEEHETFDAVVVGVAADVVSSMIYEGVDPSHLYLPTSPAGPRARHLLVEGRAVGGLRVDQIQALLRSAHADPLAFEVVPLEEFHQSQLFPLMAASWIGSTLAVLALCLSASGLYGVLIYTLGQRTREIGIRVALGATGAAIVRLVMGQSAKLAGMGAAIGALLAFGALKALGAVVPLRSVAWVDPGAFAAAMVLVAAATGAAAFLPAWRAARIDPAETLRAEG